MESASRRGFLLGRRPVSSPWNDFVRRLSRQVDGPVLDFGFHEGAGSARLQPAANNDVRHARALCASAGVRLVLAGVEQAEAWTDRSVLWVEPGEAMGRCEPVTDVPGVWFVQPGCLLRDMVQAGLQQFAHLPGYLTAAAWLADRLLCDWPSGQTGRSGLLQASVLLADGTVAQLGPFGAGARQALATARMQQCVPALFELARSPLATSCREQTLWPARYRLDALLPEEGADINLAQLLLGHGGDLAWAEWMLIAARPASDSPPMGRPAFSVPQGSDPRQPGQLDSAVKHLLDPAGVLPHFNQRL